MNSQYLKKVKLPDGPGVYSFKKGRRTLYIGRATSLRNRVRSYFAPGLAEKRSSWIEKMMREASFIVFKKTGSVLEAILLEAALIKKFKPPYNTDLKDDKSFNSVLITKEGYPRVLLARAHALGRGGVKVMSGNERPQAVYGPFPNGGELRIALALIRRIFPYRDGRCRVGQGRPCFSRQIGLCPGVCTGEITRAEYAKSIRNIRLFFEGRKTRLLIVLQREMQAAADAQKFERAGELKRQIFALKHIQDVALLSRRASFSEEDGRSTAIAATGGGIRRIEAYDISHFGGKEIVGAMAVVRGGATQPGEYRFFKLCACTGPHEVAGLQEVLRRRFTHPEWTFPDLIAVDGNEVQKRAAEEVLREFGFGRAIPVAAVVKDERHRPRVVLWERETGENERASILLANSEAHRFALKFQRRRRALQSTKRS